MSKPPAPPLTWDRANPSLATLLLVDPTLEIAPETRRLIAQQLQWGPRRIFKPLARMLSLGAVGLIVAVKRLLPFEFSSHRGIDRLCLWFMPRFVAPEACALLMRHFVVETNLLAFLARNAIPGGRMAHPIAEPSLRPTRCEDLSDGAVIRHDLNAYNLLWDLGTTPGVDVHTARPLASLDVSMLTVPPIAGETGDDGHPRWLRLDIETALYLMNIVFCLLTTTAEYERAVNSFQLDESLCAAIAGMTGDAAFRGWTPLKFSMFVTTARDVPRDLFWHSAVNEFAHTRLKRIVEAAKQVSP